MLNGPQSKIRRYRSPQLTLLCALWLISLGGCNQQAAEPLPILGTISSPYTFTNQDGKPVSQKMFDGKVYVADFFFTSCPTICPIMKTEMVRVHDAMRDEKNFLLLSHTVDPTHDTVDVLKDFADRLNVSSSRWHMVTGEKDQIYANALLYKVGAKEDKNAPGGFIHSGSFILVDRLGRIRGYYRGTETESVDLLIKHIPRLLDENV
jgi:protein SCO1/2